MSDFTLSGSGGDGLDAFAARLTRLASSEGIRGLNETAGEAVKDKVVNEFRTGTGPTGRAWKPTLAGNQPLIGETRDLSSSVAMYPTSDGFIIAVGDWKAIFHQDGTRRNGRIVIPARPMLPTGETLPAPWRAAMMTAITLYLDIKLRG